MPEQNLAIIKGLVCVAWADGRVGGEESTGETIRVR